MFEVRATITYQRLREIGVGEGKNSIVHLAYDPVLRRDIAVKEIAKSKFGNDFDSYCHEARVMFAAADPNIVDLEFVCETGDSIILALPYYANGSLQKRISAHPLPLRALLKLTQVLVAALSRIHVSRFLHLDLKPANVLFDDLDRPLLSDFGQSRRLSATGTVTYPDIYKWCMPPETLVSHVATVESDIYQLGALLYRAANGNGIYEAQKVRLALAADLQKQIERGKFPDRDFFLPHIPKRIRSILRKAMRVNPAERYRSAVDFGAVFGRVPFALDWQTQSLGNGGYVWRADRPGRPNLEVALLQDTANTWKVEVWTVRPQERRKKNIKEDWRREQRYPEAMKHLTEVFARLGQ